MITDNPMGAFSSNYAQALEKFLAAAKAANLPVKSYPHPLAGSQGEALALDVAQDGPADAKKSPSSAVLCMALKGFAARASRCKRCATQATTRVARAGGAMQAPRRLPGWTTAAHRLPS